MQKIYFFFAFCLIVTCLCYPLMTAIAQLGEQLVAQWLTTKGWTILQQNWRCRWGEIDIIAQSSLKATLAFVEVKTRSSGSWDAGGILAITLQKQAKITRTAAFFLAEYPHFAECPCRFDVALVASQKKANSLEKPLQSAIILGQPVIWQGYQLTLQQYIESAFEATNIQ